MNNSGKDKEPLREKSTQEIEKELKKMTLDELEIEFSKALYDEFKDDPEYQRRFSQSKWIESFWDKDLQLHYDEKMDKLEFFERINNKGFLP